MRAVIIGGGDFGRRQAECIKDDDFIICADRGYDNAKKYNIKADIVLGDMDSVKSEIVGAKIVYPRKKDFTDGEIALRYALEKGYKNILLTGFTGERIDHTISDLFMLHITAENDAEAMIIDEYNSIYYICDKKPAVKLYGKKDDIVSIVPLCDLKGVYTKGLEYPIENEDIEFFKSRTLCNTMLDGFAEVELKSGRALVILAKDREEDDDIS